MADVGVFLLFLAMCVYMVYDIVNMADRQRLDRLAARRAGAKQEMDQARRMRRRRTLPDLEDAILQFGDREMIAALEPLSDAMRTALKTETQLEAELSIDTVEMRAAEKAASLAIAKFAWAAKSYHSTRKTQWPTVFFSRTSNDLHEDQTELEHMRSKYARLDLCHD